MSSSWTWEPIQIPRLRAAQTRDAYNLHIAALEWDLDQPIIINSPKDIESRKNWRKHINLFEHQVRNLITFCRRAPVVLIADDVGLGKTISAGVIMSELMARKKVKRALVLCPKILLPQWKEELCSKFDITAQDGVGRAFDDMLSRNTSSVLITTYASARTRFDKINKSSFDMLILDEAHKLRNLFGGKVEPVFARNIRRALHNRVFKYVVMLTATPIQNRLWDIYSLLDCLTIAKGHEHPLGTPEAFLDKYVMDYQGKALSLYPSRKDEFRHKLSQYMVRTRRIDCNLPFPERFVNTYQADATDEENALIDLVSDQIGSLNGYSQISLAQALMSSPEALLKQMENMAKKGSLQGRVLTKAREIVTTLTATGKLSRLQELIDVMSTKRKKKWRLLIFTTRKETQKAIGRFLHEQAISYGYIEGGQSHRNYHTIERFTSDPPSIHVIVSTDAGAEGINLQASNFIVNYDLPWNPMIVEQRIGRIQRLASSFKSVQVLNLVLAGSVEEFVVVRLMEKLQMISQTVGDIEGILESSRSHHGNEDFVEMIRKMVVASLQGENVSAAMEQMSESIDIGKRIYDEHQETVEKTLGRLEMLHKTGPKMPVLTSAPPSISVRDFVLKALVEDGGTVEKAREGGYWVSYPGKRTENIVIIDSDTEQEELHLQNSEHAIRIYDESSSDFSKLVQSWKAKNEHYVCYLKTNDDVIEDIAHKWCGEIDGAECLRATVRSRKPLFQGKCIIHAISAVAHDRYSKLIESIIGKQHRVTTSNKVVTTIPPTDHDFVPEDILEDLDKHVEDAVTDDNDIASFSEFYLHRMAEEIKSVGNSVAKHRRVAKDFLPTISARVVALQGYQSDEIEVAVKLTLDGHGPYAGRFSFKPAIDKSHPKPTLIPCELTGKYVPEACLSKCSKSNKDVLNYLLDTSNEPGHRKALKNISPSAQYQARQS